MRKPVLVVLAAGMGSRYGGLKQMDSVGGHGQSIIDYSIYDARRAGFETVVLVIKREIEEDFKALIGSRIARGMDVQYVLQEMDDLPEGYTLPPQRKKPWGTTHAVLAARHVIDGPFAVINSDDYYGPEGFKQIYNDLTAHSGETGAYSMIGYQLGHTVTDNGSVSRGVCQVGENGYVQRIVEHTRIEKTSSGGRSTLDGGATWIELPGDTQVSMNFWGFQKDFMEKAMAQFPTFLDKTLKEDPEKGEYLLPMTINQLLYEKRVSVRVLPCEDQWYGVTYREDKPSVVRALAEKTAAGLYPENLWNV